MPGIVQNRPDDTVITRHPRGDAVVGASQGPRGAHCRIACASDRLDPANQPALVRRPGDTDAAVDGHFRKRVRQRCNQPSINRAAIPHERHSWTGAAENYCCRPDAGQRPCVQSRPLGLLNGTSAQRGRRRRSHGWPLWYRAAYGGLPRGRAFGPEHAPQVVRFEDPFIGQVIRRPLVARCRSGSSGLELCRQALADRTGSEELLRIEPADMRCLLEVWEPLP